MNAKKGDLITSGSTSPTALTITNAPLSKVGDRKDIEHLITVVSGTVKFGHGGTTNSHGIAAGEQLIISCPNGELYFEAASDADTFRVDV